ncbi:hypothetical protein F4803DRAFT_167235 [Xylaria telfairii]|nr:hypothetical protein F4803DRAFT_167235 [Xylaria telfairii]
MAANRGWPVVEATECPSGSGHSAPLRVPDVDMFGSLDQSLVDRLANLPDPPNPPDPSEHRSSRLGPTSPTQLASEGDSDTGQGTSVLRKKENHDDDNDNVHDDDNDIVLAVDDDDDDTLPRRDKGKAPETTYLLSTSEQRPNTKLYEEAPANLQQAHNFTEPPMGDEPSRSSVDLIETATNADFESASGSTPQSEALDASYPSSVFEEAQDYNPAATASALAEQVTSWKQKQKQKADPEAETEASEEEQPFRPLSVGDPGWEKSAGRPPQKLPVRFRDAVGRNFLFPWEKAKTWTSMRKLIQSCFLHVDVLGPHVMAGRYDLSINLPFPMDSANEILSPGTPLSPGPSQTSTSAAELPSSSTAAGPSSTPGPSSGTNSSPQQQQQQPKSSFVVLPELWDDTIEPGMLVVQHMWPFQTPNFVPQPAQPSPPQPHHHVLPTRGRGAPRGRGRGAGMFGGRGGGNLFAPPPPHPGSRPPLIVVHTDPPLRGKTRKRQDRL